MKSTRTPKKTPLPSHPPSRTLSSSVMWTIGHSTRSIEEFIGLLQAYNIHHLIDVRIIPFSRRNPQFHQEALAESLRDAGIRYLHIPDLGGRRKSRADSINMGWRNESFRGYADYMQTSKFWEALEDLADRGKKAHSAVMCAEAVPWRCHRALIADALIIQGWSVQHIMSVHSSKPHSLTPFARLDTGRLTYPSDTSDSTPRLF